MHLNRASWKCLLKSVHTTSTSATAAIQNSAHCMCLAILSDTYGHAGTTTNVWIKHAADMQSLNVHHASYCSSMLTTSNWASLGEPLQTLSELVLCMHMHIIGASLSEPHTYESTVCPPTLPVVVIYIYIYIYIYMYLFRPTILRTFSTSGAPVRLFEGPKRF